MFLTATSCVGLIYVIFTIRRLWMTGIARCCDSLMGKHSAAPRPWGQPVPAPPRVVLRGWRRPAVLIPIAIALLAVSALHTSWSVLAGIPLRDRSPLMPGVRSAAFLDSDHLAVARPEGIEIVTLGAQQVNRHLRFPGDYGRDPGVILSSNGQWVAIIPDESMPVGPRPGPTHCVRLLRLSADPETKTVDEVSQRCLATSPDAGELDVSNRGDLVVADENGAQVYFVGAEGTAELVDEEEHSEASTRRGRAFCPSVRLPDPPWRKGASSVLFTGPLGPEDSRARKRAVRRLRGRHSSDSDTAIEIFEPASGPAQ